MNVSKIVGSTVAAFAVVGAIGIAQAQNGGPQAPGVSTVNPAQTPAAPMNNTMPATGTTTTDSSMNNNSATTGMTTERAAQPDRN